MFKTLYYICTAENLNIKVWAANSSGRKNFMLSKIVYKTKKITFYLGG